MSLDGAALPPSALELYENLRAAMRAAKPAAGAAAIAFHGLWRGLQVLSAAPAPASESTAAPIPTTPAATHDRQLVRLLANMVLATQSQDCHAY